MTPSLSLSNCRVLTSWAVVSVWTTQVPVLTTTEVVVAVAASVDAAVVAVDSETVVAVVAVAVALADVAVAAVDLVTAAAVVVVAAAAVASKARRSPSKWMNDLLSMPQERNAWDAAALLPDITRYKAQAEADWLSSDGDAARGNSVGSVGISVGFEGCRHRKVTIPCESVGLTRMT